MEKDCDTNVMQRKRAFNEWKQLCLRVERRSKSIVATFLMRTST